MTTINLNGSRNIHDVIRDCGDAVGDQLRALKDSVSKLFPAEPPVPKLTPQTFGYVETRRRWQLLETMDYLGYIPVVGIAVGVFRVLGAACAVTVFGAGALLTQDKERKKELSFIFKRAMDEYSKGCIIEIFQGLSLVLPLMDLLRTSQPAYRRALIEYAPRGSIILIGSHGSMEYLREKDYVLKEGGYVPKAAPRRDGISGVRRPDPGAIFMKITPQVLYPLELQKINKS